MSQFQETMSTRVDMGSFNTINNCNGLVDLTSCESATCSVVVEDFDLGTLVTDTPG